MIRSVHQHCFFISVEITHELPIFQMASTSTFDGCQIAIPSGSGVIRTPKQRRGKRKAAGAPRQKGRKARRQPAIQESTVQESLDNKYLNEAPSAIPPVTADDFKYTLPSQSDIWYIPAGELIPIHRQYEMPSVPGHFIRFKTNGRLGVRIIDVLRDKEGAVDDPDRRDFARWGYRQCHLDPQVHYLPALKT